MNAITTKISIFINTWANYNENGAEGGFWVDLPCNLSETLERLSKSTGEELSEMEVFINDYDSEIDGLEISENDSILRLNELAETLEELDEYELEVVEALIEAEGYSIEEAIEKINSCTYYSGYTLKELAEELVADMGLPEFAERYFDYEKFARDLSFEGYAEITNGVICIY